MIPEGCRLMQEECNVWASLGYRVRFYLKIQPWWSLQSTVNDAEKANEAEMSREEEVLFEVRWLG